MYPMCTNHWNHIECFRVENYANALKIMEKLFCIRFIMREFLSSHIMCPFFCMTLQFLFLKHLFVWKITKAMHGYKHYTYTLMLSTYMYWYVHCTYYNKNRIIFTGWLVCAFVLAIGSQSCQYKPNVRNMWAVKWTLITLCLVSVTEFRSCISTSLKFSLANLQTTEFNFDWLLQNELKWKNKTWMYP